MKRFLLCSILALCVCVPAFAQKPAVGKLMGAYNITFVTDPTLLDPFTYCVKFMNNGQIGGFPNSGKFTSPSLPGWQGTWYVIGDELILGSITNPPTAGVVQLPESVSLMGK